MGSTSRRGNQITKFQEGIDGNLRDAYVAIESDLLVSNTDQITISSPPTGILAVSFDLEKLANVGRLFTKGATTVDVSEITGFNIGEKRSIVLSGGRLWVANKDVSALVKDFTVAGDFIIGNNTGTEDFKISNLRFYQTALTNVEIEQLDSEPAIAPRTTHGDNGIVAEYTFNERYAYDNGVDNVFFDTIEQYNYDKTTPIVANHAKAINYTDAELGLTSSQTVKKNFYSKANNRPFGLKFNGVNQYAFQDPVTSNVDVGTAGLSIYIDAIFRSPITSNQRLFEFNNSLNGASIRCVNVGTLQRLNIQGTDGTTSFSVSFTSILHAFDTRHKMLFYMDRSGLYRLTYLEDGRTEFVNSTVLSAASFDMDEMFVATWSFLANTFHGQINDIQIFKGAELTNNEKLELKQGKKSTSSKFVERIQFPRNTDGNLVTELGNTLAMTNFTLAEPDNNFAEKSGLPEIREALLIETGISMAGTFTSLVGMGFDIQVLTDITALSDIITGLPAITGFYINGISVANETALVDAININNLCHVDLEWSSASPTITFIHNGDNYQLIRDYYLDQLLDSEDKIRLTGNLLFSNPPVYMQPKFNYYAIHNEGSYIAGATNPENVPLVDVDTIGNRESLGWVGGDATTKLADLVANLSLINILR